MDYSRTGCWPIRGARRPFVAGVSALALVLLCAPLEHAQPAAPIEFEVAVVKRSPPPTGDSFNINLGIARNGKLTMTNVTLADCVKYAYSIVSDELITGPAWARANDLRFDVVAQAPSGVGDPQLREMLQHLLADRLKLVLRREKKQLAFLALVQSKNGITMLEAKGPGDNSGNRGRIRGNRMSMHLLATLLSRFERQTVVDLTGLSGFYEVKLDWAPSNTAETDLGDGPSLFSAVRDQLGLRLESRKGPIEVLVIEHAEKVPVEN